MRGTVRRSFGVWLIAIFVVSIFAPLAVLSFALAQYFNRMFIAESESAFESTLTIVSHHITTYAADLGRLTMAPYFYQDIMDNLIDINSGRYFEHSPTADKVNRHLHSAFSQQLATARRDVVSVLFTPYNSEEDVSFFIRRHSGSISIVRDINARQSEWYERTVEADGSVYFTHSDYSEHLTGPNHNFIHTDESLNIFSLLRLIKDTATMRPVGVIRIDAVDAVIRDIFENIPITENSVLVLFDQNNHIIYGTVDLESALLQAAENGETHVNGENDTYFISIANISGTPWKLCYFASEFDINQRTATIYYVTALFGFAFLIVALLIFYTSSRRTVQSTNTLLKEMQKIASGNLDVKLDIRSRGYLSIIAEALTQTAKRLDDHIQSEYKAVLNQRNAEYLALQSQINPHFLNNILSSFITLNRRGERETLEKSIVNLSHLFRYAESNENLSTVSGEMRFLEEYLNLQRLRFADKLEFSLTCAPETEPIVLPKLLLQPLVENAITHGMEPHGNNLMIEVQTGLEQRDERPSLVIVIIDNGTGFDTGQIGPDSIGLANIIERLELFNERSIFEITSQPGHGYKCEIVLPVDEHIEMEEKPVTERGQEEA